MRPFYGYSQMSQAKQLETVEDIVSFIVSDGKTGDCKVLDYAGEEVLSTNGIFLSRCLPALRVLISTPLIEAQTLVQ